MPFMAKINSMLHCDVRFTQKLRVDLLLVLVREMSTTFF